MALAEEAWVQFDCVTFLYYRQFAAIVAVDLATGRRAADLTRLDVERAMQTTVNGSKAIAFELVNMKVLGSPGFALAEAVPGTHRCPVDRFRDYLEALDAVGALEMMRKSKLIFPKIKRQAADRQTVLFHPAAGAAAAGSPECRPVETQDITDTLVKVMEAADLPDELRGFRIHKMRTVKVLIELAKDTDTDTLNRMLGWTDASQQWKVYSRLAQLSALVEARKPPTLSLAVAAQHMTFVPLVA